MSPSASFPQPDGSALFNCIGLVFQHLATPHSKRMCVCMLLCLVAPLTTTPKPLMSTVGSLKHHLTNSNKRATQWNNQYHSKIWNQSVQVSNTNRTPTLSFQFQYIDRWSVVAVQARPIPNQIKNDCQAASQQVADDRLGSVILSGDKQEEFKQLQYGQTTKCLLVCRSHCHNSDCSLHQLHSSRGKLSDRWSLKQTSKPSYR